MNRLQLVDRLRQECGVAGSVSTTINQTGEFARLVNWIDEAWSEIQKAHRWDFLWEAATVTISAGTHETAGSIPAHRYVKEATYNGTSLLTYVPWPQFRYLYREWGDGEPSVWAIKPDKTFIVSSEPTADLGLSVERYKNPVAMTQDSDTPALPSEYHMAIVYRAMVSYANFEEAGVVRATAIREYERIMREAGATELEEMEWGSPLC